MSITKQVCIGFTGTRNGMTPEQRSYVGAYLTGAMARHRLNVRAVHGDCVGADNDFDELCIRLSVPRGIRPCTAPAHLRARCHTKPNPAKVLTEPKRPMARNRDIVADADVLLACPPNTKPIKSGSGTWATIGFGKRAGIEVRIVYPSGEAEMFGSPDGPV